MISRRNIRVKVMQTLYALESTEESSVKLATASKLLKQQLAETSELFIYLLYNIIGVAQYAETDAQQRATRYLAREEDKKINTKIAKNEIICQLINDPAFQQQLTEYKLSSQLDMDIIKKLYLRLINNEAYKIYIAEKERTKAAEKKILSFLFNELMMKSELFEVHLEELFIHWADDKEMMEQLVNNFINKPVLFNFQQLLSKEKVDYAKELLQTTIDKKDYCLELIKPKLQNWDPERIATIDMLLMEMGICELLYFPTIPIKVTINEYIDLGKAYSTPQSGQFINGILDNILKDLKSENRIHKTDRNKK